MSFFSASPTSWNSLIQQVALPLLEVRILLEHASGHARTWLMAHGEELADPTSAAQFFALVQKRQQGQPMAYLLGQREFFGLLFAVNPAVLIPRPDTEILVQWIVDHAPREAVILELGTGSGCIAVSVAHTRPDVRVLATDLSAQALAVAQKNAETHRVSDRIEWLESNWYQAIAPKTPVFDLIVSNPPYIAYNDEHLVEGDLRFEPSSALTDGANGLTALLAITQGAQVFLKHQGALVMEHGYDQGLACRQLLQSHGFVRVETLPDWEHRDRVTLGWI